MFRKLIQTVLILLAVFGVSVGYAGPNEDWFTKTYIEPNIANTTTAGRDTAEIKGKLNYDSTLDGLIVDNGSQWNRVLQGNSKLEMDQTTAPTVSSCTNGSVATGSSDTAGRVTGITGTTCTVLFNTRYANTPFAVVGRSSVNGGNNNLRFEVFTTGLDVYGLTGTPQSFDYLVIGYY